MLARLDEFESLTPLIMTPGSSDEVTARRLPQIASQSPPPPRRNGSTTLIVPLGSHRGELLK